MILCALLDVTCNMIRIIYHLICWTVRCLIFLFINYNYYMAELSLLFDIWNPKLSSCTELTAVYSGSYIARKDKERAYNCFRKSVHFHMEHTAIHILVAKPIKPIKPVKHGFQTTQYTAANDNNNNNSKFNLLSFGFWMKNDTDTAGKQIKTIVYLKFAAYMYAKSQSKSFCFKVFSSFHFILQKVYPSSERTKSRCKAN